MWESDSLMVFLAWVHWRNDQVVVEIVVEAVSINEIIIEVLIFSRNRLTHMKHLRWCRVNRSLVIVVWPPGPCDDVELNSLEGHDGSANGCSLTRFVRKTKIYCDHTTLD